jgi:hypothetical protein
VKRPEVCFHLYVAVLEEMLDESIVCEFVSFGETVHTFADFDDNVSDVEEGLELVLLRDAGRNDFDGDSHVLVMVHRSVQVEVYEVDRLALRVDRTLLKRHLAVVMSAVGVLTSPGDWMRLPLTMKRIRLVLNFSCCLGCRALGK